MSNEIEKFRFEDAFDIRVVIIDEEPWFVAKDVTGLLGYANGPQAVQKHVSAGHVSSISVADGTPGNPNKTVISEQGLYQLIMRSDKPEAKKFQAWVTGEVLPTIRKTGGAYIQPGSQAAQAMLDDPLGAIEQTLQVARKLQEQNRLLEAAKAELEEQAAINEPKVEFADKMSVSVNVLSFEETAKILNEKHGLDTGRNRLMKTLRDRGVLMSDKGGYRPYQRYAKFFEVEVTPFIVSGRIHTKYVTRVKTSSLPWLVRELSKP